MLTRVINTHTLTVALTAVLFGALMLVAAQAAEAATFTWTGGTDGDWNDGSNWFPALPDTDGTADLIFPTGISTYATTNDFTADTPFNSITVEDSSYTMTGNSVAINLNFVYSGTGTLTLDLDISNNDALFSFYGSDDIVFTNTFTLTSGAVIFDGDYIDDVFEFGTGSLITGDGSVTFDSMRAELSVANTYSGSTYLTGGIVYVDDNDAFGTSPLISVADDATLELDSASFPVANNFEFIGSGISAAGSIHKLSGSGATINGNIELLGNTTWVLEDSLFVYGVVSDNGSNYGITQQGGSLIIGGTLANTFTGTMIVEHGTLNLSKTSGFNAIGGDLEIGDSTGSPAYYLQFNNEQIPNTAVVTISDDGSMDQNGYNETYDSLYVSEGDYDTDGGDLYVSLIDMTGGEIDSGAGTIYMDGDITGTSTASEAATIWGSLNFGSYTPTITAVNGPIGAELNVMTSISGTGGLNLDATGYLYLGGFNDYIGVTTILADANVIIGASSSLGTIGDGTVMQAGSLLIPAGGVTVDAEPLTMNAGAVLQGSPASNTWTGPITLAGADAIIKADSGGTLNVTSVISGNYDLIIQGNNSVSQVIVTAVSTFVGTLTIESGNLVTNIANAFPSTTPLIVESGANFDMNGRNQEVGSISGDGGVLNDSVTFTFGSDNSDTTYGGVIYAVGAGHVTKVGTGTTIFTGNNDYPGVTTVSAGVLIINGTQTGSAVVVNGGTVKGTGTIGGLSVTDGVVAPGESPGIMSITGNFAITGPATFEVEIDGLTVGTEYDQLTATGSITLSSNPILDIILGFTPSIGDVFTIMTADGSISGTFNGLPDETEFELDGVFFRIDYETSSVTLTVIEEPEDPVPTLEELADTGVEVPVIVSSALILLGSFGLAAVISKDSSKLDQFSVAFKSKLARFGTKR